MTYGVDKIDVSAVGITGIGVGANQVQITLNGVFHQGIKIFDITAAQNLSASDFIFG